jgi:hypothetical protein
LKKKKKKSSLAAVWSQRCMILGTWGERWERLVRISESLGKFGNITILKKSFSS